MERGTILLVDDNSQILSITSNLLRPLGYIIVSATDGLAALALAIDHPPDLVLLDVMMPGMDGFAVCRQMRAHPLLAHVPIILVTALDDRESRVRGFEAGADEFVSKPFDYVELRARVSTILRLNRYRRLLDEQARTAAERARFVWAVEQSADGILILGPNDEPRYANPRARLLLGLPPDAPLDVPFLALAMRAYVPTPPEAWEGWPGDLATAASQHELVRFLVRPERRATPETWLRVELLPPSLGDDARVLCLRDVTEQISTQREMWTFHAMIGHKLRTPLVGILGGLNILAGGASTMDRDSIARIAGVALDAARRLRAEIEDILHYLRPPADPYDGASPSVAEVATYAAQIAADLGVAALTVWHDPALAKRQLGLNRHGIEVVLREMLENSLKFHPQRTPSVEIALIEAGQGDIALSVRDDGPGLLPKQLALVWRPYYQGEPSFTGQVEGMGLGLALVARIVHTVGGRCEIANRTGGQGAVVTLTLPLTEP